MGSGFGLISSQPVSLACLEKRERGQNYLLASVVDFLGRPRGRIVRSSLRFLLNFLTHASEPKGRLDRKSCQGKRRDKTGLELGPS
jgi:hypothetical protein